MVGVGGQHLVGRPHSLRIPSVSFQLGLRGPECSGQVPGSMSRRSSADDNPRVASHAAVVARPSRSSTGLHREIEVAGFVGQALTSAAAW